MGPRGPQLKRKVFSSICQQEYIPGVLKGGEIICRIAQMSPPQKGCVCERDRAVHLGLWGTPLATGSGFEPENQGFKIPYLTAWLTSIILLNEHTMSPRKGCGKVPPCVGRFSIKIFFGCFVVIRSFDH